MKSSSGRELPSSPVEILSGVLTLQLQDCSYRGGATGIEAPHW
ncbi:hypothetical protein CSPAE12_07979 [Colletotrichum incanum]|nr:hypothetical protein CSPAE12_07979 [Colletotrichum incanum]